ncbi:MAG: type VI secretion system membrane subunit TssM [Proteobacteria bacterium]|nr:type VI secretion system membrane subunit TssM [Pseudomonadota bacterium]
MLLFRNLITRHQTLSFLGIWLLALTLLLGAWLLQLPMRWVIFTCGLLAAIWIGMLIRQHRMARRASTDLSEMLENQGEASRSPDDTDPERVDALKLRMQDAIKKIKASKLGQLSGSEALYELPWYITIGNPAAGKSTAIVNSGLHFPFDDGGQAVIKGIGGTRNCDWFFTTEGILLDTAGRYSVREEDSAEWLGFLGLLKKHRPRAPINGILVAVSIGELIHSEPEFALNLAKDLRQRMQELTEQLEVFAPVYVLFTKADLLPGFCHFFSDLDWIERNRVWGATFPYEHATGGQDVMPLFEKRFDELYLGLRTASVARLSHSYSESPIPELLTFPAEFAAIKPALRAFIATLFEENPFQFQPVFRGFYLTSAIQNEDTSALSSERVAREFGLSAQPTNSYAQSTAQGYFLKQLFSEVIFSDRNLVRQHTTRAHYLWRQTAIVGSLVVLGAALAGWSWSYMNNLSLLKNVEQDLAKAVKIQDGRFDLQSRLEALEILQDRLAQLERFNEHPPLALGLGLYRGEQMADKLREEYFAGVSAVMLLPIKNALENFLAEVNRHENIASPQAQAVAMHAPTQYKSANASNIEDSYNALKTYLMLSSHEHIDVGHLSDQITRFWRGWLEANRGAMEREKMITLAGRIVSFHLEHASAYDWPTISNNLALVDGVREKLRRVVRGMPAAERVYGEIRARASTRFAPMSVASIVGADNAPLISGSRVVSGAVTAEAWKDYVQPAIKDAATNAQESADWVLQSSNKDDLTLEGSPEQIQKALTAMYKRDFTEEWKQFILGISITPFPTFPEAVTAMGRLGAPNISPIGKLLRTISEQTAWDNPQLTHVALQKAQSGVVEWFRQSVLQIAPVQITLDSGALPKTTEPVLGAVAREFSAIDRLAAPRDGGESLLETYLKQLSKIRSRLNELKNQGDPGPGALKVMRETLDGGNSELAETLKFVDEQMLTGIPESQRTTLRPLLLRPLLETYTALIKPATEDLNKTWVAQVYEPFTRRLAIKYPFSPKAGIEASPAEIAQMFGPDGAISKYVEATIGSLVVRRGSTITPRTWGDLGLTLQPEFMTGFAQWVSPLEGGAASDTGQGGALQTQTVFMLRPQPSPGLTSYTLEIDGQKLTYRNGAPQWTSFTWPGTSNAPGAKITVSTYDGKTLDTVNHPGRFGLEKMINAAQRSKQPDGSFRLSWKNEGTEVSIDLKVISNTQAQGSSPTTQGQRGLGGLTLPDSAITRATVPQAPSEGGR